MNEVSKETLDRVRRIETRVTKVADHFGIDVGGGKPRWVSNPPVGNSRVVIPTPNCSIKDVLRVIPAGTDKDEVDVYADEEYLFTLFIDG